MISEQRVSCPYCGETFETTVDASAGTQRYIEDCQVCCRPIEFILEIDANMTMRLRLTRDDE